MTSFASVPAPNRGAAFSAKFPLSIDACDVRFQQLRHQTKNALQHILLMVAEAPEIHVGLSGKSLSNELQRRILLVASLSDALFGLTRAPGTPAQRLASVCVGVKTLVGDPNAEIDLRVVTEDGCPEIFETVILRLAYELVGNAVRHGMYARLLGKIDVTLDVAKTGITLTVRDNGWGCCDNPVPGAGLSLARDLASEHNGTLRLQCQDGWTAVTAVLPLGKKAAQ